jgi:rhodanese-related sulfurtransferase
MKRATYFYAVVGFLIVAAIFGYAYIYAISSPYLITSEEGKRRIKAGEIDLILDVRTDLELSTLGFYPGSVHIQSADLEKEMPTRYPDKKIRILAYCNSGQRARAATEKLHKLGYENAVYIATTYTSLQ